MSIHERVPKHLSAKELQEKIRSRELKLIKEEDLSVKDALKRRINPFTVAEIAETEQDYFEIACTVLDTVGIQGMHQGVRKKELSFDTADPSTAYLTADIAHGLVESKLEEIHWTHWTPEPSSTAQKLLELRERFAKIIEKTSPML